MAGDKPGQIELAAAVASLRVRVDALLTSSEKADVPGDVVESAMNEMQALCNELRPLSVVAKEFSTRWKRQKAGLLKKRVAEAEQRLRQASSIQIAQMEAEAENQVTLIHEDFAERRRLVLDKVYRLVEPHFQAVIDDWKSEVQFSDWVNTAMVDAALKEAISKTADWARKEETRIMSIWEQELKLLTVSVHGLDEEEVQAMEKARLARCNLMESTVERQQQDLQAYGNELQGKIANKTKLIVRRAIPREDKERTTPIVANAKRQAKARAVAKKEAEISSQLHVDVAIRYLDEAAAFERARVSAYHTAMQEIGSDLAEQLQNSLVSETEQATLGAKSSKNDTTSTWALASANATATGFPTSQKSPQLQLSATSSMDDDPFEAGIALQNELVGLREKARKMMAEVGRADWRKEILEVADSAVNGLHQTEAALAAGPLQEARVKYPKATRDALAAVDGYAADFSENVVKEFTRMRNVKVALSCSRSKHVREAMQEYEKNSSEMEAVILPAASKLCHEVEVIRQVINASKAGTEKMPIYIIAAAFRRSLLAMYPVLKPLWETAGMSLEEQKRFLKKMSMYLAVEPTIGPLFQAEQQALEATLPAPDWGVAM